MSAEVAVEATAVAGGVDTVAATTATMVMMMTMTMTQLNICDALMEKKDLPSNPSRMHATIK